MHLESTTFLVRIKNVEIQLITPLISLITMIIGSWSRMFNYLPLRNIPNKRKSSKRSKINRYADLPTFNFCRKIEINIKKKNGKMLPRQSQRQKQLEGLNLWVVHPNQQPSSLLVSHLAAETDQWSE